MKCSGGTIESVEDLSESQRTALLNLLADEDPRTYQAIRKKILSFGYDAAEWLRPHRLSNDPALRRRTQQLIIELGRQAADNNFLAFCLQNGEGFDLEQGAWLLAQTQYPEISVEGYQALLDAYTADLRGRLVGERATKDTLTEMNDYLFGDLGFAGNEQDYYDPENSFLNRVIDRHVGNPINLCLLYILVARRLGLPITGIGLPGHFLCRYQSTSSEIYIDAFNQGKLLAKADCVQYLLQGNYSVREEYLAPVSPRRFLLRICGNLHQIYLHLQRQDDATRLQRYLVALAR